MNGRFISVATFLIEKSTVMRSLRVESLWLMPRRGYWLVLLKILTTNTLFFSQRVVYCCILLTKPIDIYSTPTSASFRVLWILVLMELVDT